MGAERRRNPSGTVRAMVGRGDREQLLYHLSETFRVLGDLTRVRILAALLDGEKCVRDLALALGLNDSAVSHQLRILRGSRLVKFRREGKNVHYSVSDEHVETIYRHGIEHVKGL